MTANAKADLKATKSISSDAVTVEDLQQRLIALEQLAAVGELSSTVTHEFNNVLMTILNYAQLGLKQKDEATRDKAFQKIHDSATRAAKICATVLSITRNSQQDNPQTNAKSLIKDTLVLLERELQKYRIYVEQQLDDLPALAIDANSLQRVLINLITNARQAIGERGTLTIRLTRDSSAGCAALSIRDSGSGIPANLLPKIFDRFFTTKNGPDASGKGGTGLGLSMCREIIEKSGGRIRVESAVGKGTVFTLRIPIAKVAATKQSA